jgi:hypothetical protein
MLLAAGGYLWLGEALTLRAPRLFRARRGDAA